MNPSELIAQQGTHRTIAFHNIGIKFNGRLPSLFKKGFRKQRELMPEFHPR